MSLIPCELRVQGEMVDCLCLVGLHFTHLGPSTLPSLAQLVSWSVRLLVAALPTP